MGQTFNFLAAIGNENLALRDGDELAAMPPKKSGPMLGQPIPIAAIMLHALNKFCVCRINCNC